jgi:hypothetical protein
MDDEPVSLHIGQLEFEVEEEIRRLFETKQ